LLTFIIHCEFVFGPGLKYRAHLCCGAFFQDFWGEKSAKTMSFNSWSQVFQFGDFSFWPKASYMQGRKEEKEEEEEGAGPG